MGSGFGVEVKVGELGVEVKVGGLGVEVKMRGLIGAGMGTAAVVREFSIENVIDLGKRRLGEFTNLRRT